MFLGEDLNGKGAELRLHVVSNSATLDDQLDDRLSDRLTIDRE